MTKELSYNHKNDYLNRPKEKGEHFAKKHEVASKMSAREIAKRNSQYPHPEFKSKKDFLDRLHNKS